MSAVPTKADPPRRYWELLRFAIPVSLELILQHGLGLVDHLFVARLGDASFVGAGLTAQLVSTVFVVLMALILAGSVHLARYAGAGDTKGFSATGALLVQSAAVFGVILSAAVMFWAEPLLQLLGAQPDVVERGAFFTRLIGWSLPMMALAEAGNQVLRARGEVQTPVLIGLAALVTNTGLNALAIFGAPGIPAMGLGGVALATVVARSLALGLVAWRVSRGHPTLKVHPEDLLAAPDLGRLKGLLALALPILAGQGTWTLGMLAYTRVFSTLGTSAMAANGILATLESLLLHFSTGFATASVVLVGHELGRKNEEAAQDLAADALRLTAGISVVTGSALALCSLLLGQLFPGMAPETLALAALGTVVAGVLQPVKALNMILAGGILRGGGDVRFVFLCEGLLAVGIASTWTLGVALGLGYAGALAGRAIEEVLKLGAFLTRFRSRRWIHSLGLGGPQSGDTSSTTAALPAASPR